MKDSRLVEGGELVEEVCEGVSRVQVNLGVVLVTIGKQGQLLV